MFICFLRMDFDECMDLNMLKIGIEIYAKAVLRLSEYI